MRIVSFIKIVVLMLYALSAGASAPANFSHAKKITFALFKNHQTTLYCGCAFNQKKQIELSSCNMESAANIKRAKRVEAEHMMPAENFGRQYECWRKPLCQDKHGKAFKGRRCCQKIDARFKHVEAELYNPWPAVGIANQARSNYRFSPLPKKDGLYRHSAVTFIQTMDVVEFRVC